MQRRLPSPPLASPNLSSTTSQLPYKLPLLHTPHFAGFGRRFPHKNHTPEESWPPDCPSHVAPGARGSSRPRDNRSDYSRLVGKRRHSAGNSTTPPHVEYRKKTHSSFSERKRGRQPALVDRGPPAPLWARYLVSLYFLARDNR
jgi:hypothetical protein